MTDVTFVTYASGSYRKNIFWNRFFVKYFFRPKELFFFTDDNLKKDLVYLANRKVFDAKMGGGYWAWKPWVILQAMRKAAEGDLVVYQDCGKGLKYKIFARPKGLLDFALSHGAMPGVFVPSHGENWRWTHAKCFEVMGCNNPKYFESPQVEASVSMWVVNDKNIAFLEEWLSFCLDLDVVGDSTEEERDGFVCHRYDQSILTNLVIKYDYPAMLDPFDVPHFSKSLSFLNLSVTCGNPFLGAMYSCLLGLLKLRRFLKQ